MIMTSGTCWAAWSMATWPFSASSTTSTSGNVLSRARSPERTMGWSSTTMTRIAGRVVIGGVPVRGRLTSTRPPCGVGPAAIEPPTSAVRSAMADSPTPAVQVSTRRAVVAHLDPTGGRRCG